MLFSCITTWAQSNGETDRLVDFSVTVSGVQAEGKVPGSVLTPFVGAQIHLTTADGLSFDKVSGEEGRAIFKDLRAGSEYIVEISANGYSITIYHGKIPQNQRVPLVFFTIKNPSGEEIPPLKAPEPADVEGFVVTSGRLPFVTEPLPDAYVLYTSSSDSLYTTTDVHGYFRFDNVKDKAGKVSVSHMTCKDTEATLPAKNGSRWLWIKTEEDPEKLAAAKITSTVPLITVVRDTIRYNVAATQKIMSGDRLGDVLLRLPGITFDSGTLMFRGKPISEIIINKNDLFGGNQRNALSYLAGVQINKIDIYEEKDERNPQRRRQVMNVKTKRFLKDITDIDVSTAGGGNMPLSSQNLLPPERWQAGFGARYFSVPLIATLDIGTNNLGIESGKDLTKITNAQIASSELVKPVFAAVNVRKALALNESKTRAVETINFDYSFKKNKKSSDNQTERSYDPDENWTSRETKTTQQSIDNKLTHSGKLSWSSNKRWYPHAEVSLSRNEHDSQSEYLSKDQTRTDGLGDKMIALHQVSRLNSRNYTFAASAGAGITNVQRRSASFGLSFGGGEGDGSNIRYDSTSVQKTWITSDEGQNRHIAANAHITQFFVKGGDVSLLYNFSYDHAQQRRLNYDEVINDEHLNPLTSEDSRSNVYNNDLVASLRYEKILSSVGVKSSHVIDSRELPYIEGVNKIFLAPVIRFEWRPFYNSGNRLSFSVSTSSSTPSLNQLGSVFHDSNPLLVSRGNPSLKQAHTLSFNTTFNKLLSGGTLDFQAFFRYKINEIVSTRAYCAEETVIDGYTLPAGATFSSYENSTGGIRWDNYATYSTYIRPIRYGMDFSINYTYSKSPSFVNERFEYYTSRQPVIKVNAKSNFSSRYRLDFSLYSSLELTESPYYGETKYGRFSASVNSDNRITDWLFLRAGYSHSSRIPISDRVTRTDIYMLNASTGVYLMDHKLCIALIFKDILNNAPTLTTSAKSNYIETVRTINMNRYMLLSVRYLFNSSEK